MEQFNPALAVTGPYTDAATNKIYQLLFCDDPALYKEHIHPPYAYPWNILLGEGPDIVKLHEIIDDEQIETRPRVLAYKRLAGEGASIGNKELLGVIVEVGLDGGADVIAAYEDGTARYISQTGKMVVWEKHTEASDELIDQLFDAGIPVVNQLKPWKEKRRPYPAEGLARISFLVSGGLYFREGPFDQLQSDPATGPVIEAATGLLSFLTAQAGEPL